MTTPTKEWLQIAERDAEIARLTACLHKANSQTEEFERKWYLRGDAIEAKDAEIARIQELHTGLMKNADDMNDELRAEIAGLRADKERLDFCEQYKEVPSVNKTTRNGVDFTVTGWLIYCDPMPYLYVKDTIREAIDTLKAVLASQKEST